MAMKWIELATCKKEPEFKVNMIVLLESGTWEKANLYKIETTTEGKQYLFDIFDRDEPYNIERGTHYLVPESLPKNNQ